MLLQAVGLEAMTDVSRKMDFVGLGYRLMAKFAECCSYLVVAVGALAIIAGMWWAIASQLRYERQNAIDKAEFRNDGIVIAYEDFILRTLKSADTVTRVMEAVLKYNRPEPGFHKLKESGIIDGNVFQSVGVLDAKGDLIASTLGPNVQKFNFSDRQYFKDAVGQTTSELIVGAPVTSRITARVEVPIVRRLSKENGTFDGLIVVLVNGSAFTNVYRNFGIRGNDFIALIGFDGIARAAQVGTLNVPGRDFGGTNVMAQQRGSPSGRFAAKGLSDGITRYVSYRTLPGYPLFVATGAEEREVFQEFDGRKARYLTAGAISTLLILMFAAVLIVVLRIKDRTNAKLRSNEAMLKELATHDSLTALPNRTLLEARAAEEIAAARHNGTKVACIFVDLDKFGAINEAFGHLVGDEVLRAVAAAIRRSIDPGCTASRIGGDEFVMIAPADQDAESLALNIAATLRSEFANFNLVAGKSVTIRASVGISRYPQDGETLSDLIRCADAAMLQSKANRRAESCVFTAKMNREAERRLKTQSDLADAIRCDELEVFYQPQVSLPTQSVIGIEALVRWRHPRLGLLPPADFIPIAEESGLIVPLGEWVLNRACRDGETLRREGYGDLSIAVNVSALQFRQPELVELIAGVLDRSGLAPSCLELELTESMVADDPEIIIARLVELKSLGVRLALDDFGTGYSNLQYLRQFPLDVLKIDRSFVMDLPDNSHAASIAVAVVSLARSLRIERDCRGCRNQKSAGIPVAGRLQRRSGIPFRKSHDARRSQMLAARRQAGRFGTPRLEASCAGRPRARRYPGHELC